MMQLQTWTWTRASSICLVEGHIWLQSWASPETDAPIPTDVPTECSRCGSRLLKTEEIGDDE